MEIVVCLSRDLTFFSNITYLVDGGGFTHASLGLRPEDEYYYSFNFKGMKKEYRSSLAKKPREITRYIIRVPDEAWKKLSEIIEEMLSQKEKYQYSKLGVSMRLLHFKNESQKEDSFFCSQFVAAVLKDSGCVDIQIDPAQCTPNDLLKELTDSGQIVRVEEEKSLSNPGEDAINLAIRQIEKGHDKLKEIADENLDPSKGISGKAIPALALSMGLSKTNELYEKMMDKLGTAENAVGDAPENFAKLTSSLLKQGTGKLSEVKDKVDDTIAEAKNLFTGEHTGEEDA